MIDLNKVNINDLYELLENTTDKQQKELIRNEITYRIL